MNKTKLKKIIVNEIALVNEKREFDLMFESFLGTLFQGAIRSFSGQIKKRICETVIEHLGMNSAGPFAQAVCEFFENTDVSQIWTFLTSRTPESCRVVARGLLTGLTEVLVQNLTAEFTHNTPVLVSLREFLTDSLNRNNSVIDAMAARLCRIDFTHIVSSLTGGGSDNRDATTPPQIQAVQEALSEINKYSSYKNKKIILEKHIIRSKRIKSGK